MPSEINTAKFEIKAPVASSLSESISIKKIDDLPRDIMDKVRQHMSPADDACFVMSIAPLWRSEKHFFAGRYLSREFKASLKLDKVIDCEVDLMNIVRSSPGIREIRCAFSPNYLPAFYDKIFALMPSLRWIHTVRKGDSGWDLSYVERSSLRAVRSTKVSGDIYVMRTDTSTESFVFSDHWQHVFKTVARRVSGPCSDRVLSVTERQRLDSRHRVLQSRLTNMAWCTPITFIIGAMLTWTGTKSWASKIRSSEERPVPLYEGLADIILVTGATVAVMVGFVAGVVHFGVCMGQKEALEKKRKLEMEAVLQPLIRNKRPEV